MRLLRLALLLLATPLRAIDCTGTDLLAQMAPEDRLRIEARAGITPYGEGLLWRATRDGTTLTLFGTYHLPHTATEAQLDALLPQAMAADFSWFEMNAPDQKAFQTLSATDASVMFITDGPTLPELLSEADWQRLRAQMAERGFPSFFAAKFKPIFVSLMLGISPCQLRAQKAGEKGIDARLAAALDEAGRDTRSIEEVATVMRLLDGFSRDEQVAMVRLMLDVPIAPDDMQQTMLNLYVPGRVAMVWEFAREMSIRHGGPNAAADFDRLEKVMLNDRNRAWAERIEAEAPGHDVFIAVGAGHLPGPSGLLTLLAQRGWTIEPLPLPLAAQD